jgi:hypothetical protein
MVIVPICQDRRKRKKRQPVYFPKEKEEKRKGARQKNFLPQTTLSVGIGLYPVERNEFSSDGNGYFYYGNRVKRSNFLNLMPGAT